MRKVMRFVVPGAKSDKVGSRDAGKVFIITEMPADRAERWALRALFAMQKSGVEIPDDAAQAGLAALYEVGFKALTSIPWEVAEPLLAEMMGCVQYEHAPNVPLQPIMEGENSQIEDVTTRLLLRAKVFELHTGFSLPAARPT